MAVSPLQIMKRLFDSNELPWTLPLPPWAPPRQRSLRKIRQLARKQMRAQLVANQGWLRTLTQVLAWPAISTLKAAIATRPHQGLWGYKLGLFATYCRLQWIHNIRISDQEQHALMLPQRRAHANDYMICRENQTLIDLCALRCRGYPNLGDKRFFFELCSENSLPTPMVLSMGQADEVRLLTTWPKRALILKPAYSSKGRGIEILPYDDATSDWRGSRNVALNPENIAAYARQKYGPKPWILQPRLSNSTEWEQFKPGCLATARVITGKLGKNGSPVCMGMYLRIPRQGAIVDNLSAGGIGIEINLQTGHLSKGHIYLGGFEEHTHHPDTGLPIEGESLPGFRKLIDLALEAHDKAGDWCTVGWDVSLTEDGPQLIEANMHWAIMPRSPIIDKPYTTVFEHALKQPTLYTQQ